MNLFNMFTTDEWTAWNSSGSQTDIVRLENNGISTVNAFPSLNIRFLSFKHNVITKIEKNAFKNLTLLEHLDLSYNKITTEELKPEVFEGKYSPETYEPLKNLKILKLGNNRLHSLDPDIFEHLPNLEHLSLESNPFMVIDQGSTIAISGLAKLKVMTRIGKTKTI